MKHDFFTSKDIAPDDEWSQRNIIDGGLSLCKVCGGLEGGLTTDCPGDRIPYEYDQKVYKGELDYVEGKGWIIQASKHSPAYWTKERLEAHK